MRFEIPEDKKLVHELQIPIRWGDMDAAQHVNNTLYFRYFETIRIDWPGTLYAAGGTKMVWIDMQTQRSIPVPEWLRAIVA
jgi:acyl-CoA thioesterase FadM